MKRITIDPITRLEGHGKIEIFLTDEGEVDNVYFQVPELRGFEKFCEGRPVEELAQIVTKICGVCPGCHHMAAGKAIDAVFGLEPPPTAKKIRELFYMAHFVHSHIAHFYALAAPDFVVGPTADPAERNVLGVIGKVGKEIGTEVLKQRRLAQEIQALLGGHQTHVVLNMPGGVRKGLNESQRADIEQKAIGFIDFAKFSLKLFEDVVLSNDTYVNLILDGPYNLKIHSMGLVDENNKVNFYEGKVRVVDTVGNEHCKYAASDYQDYIAERVEPWSYLKFPYLKKIGWKGFIEGQDSGVYQATPLSRLNAADGMATPLAQEAYEKMFKTFNQKPVHATLAMHWARLVELLYSAERMLELITDPDITGKDLRAEPKKIVGEGVGIVEAQRGTLTHHYWTDSKGLVTKANIVVGTTNNNAAICMSLKKAAQGVIQKGVTVDQGILNMIEMAFRAYDPCFSCATHSLPGQMPMIVNFRDPKNNIIRSISR
ncbi:MAG: Ni/Fe hydrogenase subunit alpha [Bacteroidetes bacterium]|jgi:F420-non-reducing hydrogenase large subunit|nr:Ni/Fe hydrogenase subunit alpha [Bacteroidota bacterium]MBT3750112.1 Ni/Fe hydrogenase subunit alpha [Bacteroidota bacterium]MBT4399239.1 Ni/Fe hydrogenase subunit alpha [Bacteroidota bacterium]MBT4409977.1 Ni/Fe hydrogenase subunit alpha [Bacteroidota bacterium]MBT7095429.1 Ni/Fe hydrogenase subunit alpha [Bacteroidota bacterium]